MKHSISHDLGADLATKATKAAFESYRQKYEKYEPRAVWHSDRHADVTFKVKLVRLQGRLEIHDDRVEMDLDVPLMLRVFREKALGAIEREVRVWIDKARAGELD